MDVGLPYCVLLDHDPPNAREQVDIDHEEENHFGQFHARLHILCDVEERYDFVEPEDPAKLQKAEQLIVNIAPIHESLNDLVKWNCGNQVEPELSVEVVSGDIARAEFLVTAAVDISGSESDEHIQEENNVNAGIQNSEQRCIHNLGRKCDFERDGQTVENGEEHDQEVPLRFEGVVWSEHIMHVLNFLPNLDLLFRAALIYTNFKLPHNPFLLILGSSMILIMTFISAPDNIYKFLHRCNLFGHINGLAPTFRPKWFAYLGDIIQVMSFFPDLIALMITARRSSRGLQYIQDVHVIRHLKRIVVLYFI